MYPKVYIPILWLLSHVILPVCIVVSGIVFFIAMCLIREFLTPYIRMTFHI
jgi:hypothetical protein